MHEMPCAFAFALPSAGNNIPAKIAMMAITTRSSINVKARQPVGVLSLVLILTSGCSHFRAEHYATISRFERRHQAANLRNHSCAEKRARPRHVLPLVKIPLRLSDWI